MCKEKRKTHINKIYLNLIEAEEALNVAHRLNSGGLRGVLLSDILDLILPLYLHQKGEIDLIACLPLRSFYNY